MRLSAGYDVTPHLPPVSVAPILEHYDPETRRLNNETLLQAPVDDRGVVKVFDTLDLALSLVDPDYTWPREQCDIHHFVWRREVYTPENNGGDMLPSEYREVSFHKGYLPRQLHNFIHAVVDEPIKPSLEVMERRVRAYKLACSLFSAARLATKFEKRPESFLTVRRKPWRAMTVDEGALVQTLEKLRANYSEQFDPSLFENELFFDLGLLESGRLDTIARHLGKFAATDAINLNPYITGNRESSLIV